jgi:hypothetical protein
VLVLCFLFLKWFPVSQGSIVSAIGYGINAIISAIAAVIETIVGAIVAVRTLCKIRSPLNLIRICHHRYLWRSSTLFTTSYAVAALVDALGAPEAEHIIVGEDFSAAAGARGALAQLLAQPLAHTNVAAVGRALTNTEDVLAGHCTSRPSMKIDD